MAFERSLPPELATDESVAFRVGDDLAELWLNRPAKLNATSDEMVQAIDLALEAIAERSPRALVIGGTGRAFCAGRDLADAHPEDEDAERILANLYNPLILRLAGLDVITVAAVHGAVLGTGLGFALACDFVIASSSSRWGSPFARIGAVLDSGGHYFFQRLGHQRIMDLILLGDLFDGSDAFNYGFASRVVDDDHFEEEVERYVQRVAHGPTQAFLASKRILNRARIPALAEVLAMEAEAQGGCARTLDYATGIRSFVEHQEPRFEGR
jgi:enoyl-CoA hydratase/carnithine racemase